MERIGRIAALAALVLSTSGLGCGGLSPRSFCQQFSSEMVSRIMECGGAPSGTEGDIENAFGISPATLCPPIEGAVNGGRAKFDAGNARACLDKISSATCAQLAGLDTGPCATFLVGQVPAGGSCYTDYDCQPNGYCDSSHKTCPGKCQALVPAGGDCSGGGPGCVNGTYCDGKVCKPNPTEGQSCDPSQSNCAGGLYCDASANGGTCKAQGGPGDACPVADACGMGTACFNGTCMGPSKAGETCFADAQCGLFTSCVSGTCTEYPTTGAGCGQQGQSTVGCVGSYCKQGQSSTGTCTAYLAIGQTCDPNASDESCGPGAACDANNACAPAASLDCAEP